MRVWIIVLAASAYLAAAWTVSHRAMRPQRPVEIDSELFPEELSEDVWITSTDWKNGKNYAIYMSSGAVDRTTKP